MKKIYLSFLFSLAVILSANAQQFAVPNLTIPLIEGTDTLQNPWAGGLNSPLVSAIDLDQDGLKDLFFYDRTNHRITTMINDGSTSGNAYHYDYRYFNKFPPINEWVLLVDFDCDGKEDMFTLASCNCGVAIYKNTSTTGGGLQFTLFNPLLKETDITNPVPYNIFASSLAIPAFSDIDNDGDLDLLGYNSVPDGRIQYHKNYSVENGYGCDSMYAFRLEANNWGYFRLRIGSTNNVACYVCRTGEGEPGTIGAQYGPFNDKSFHDQSSAAVRDDSNTSVFAIDLDGDNDKELLIGDITATNTLMVCNGGTPSVALMDSLCGDTLFPSYDTAVRIRTFSHHAYIDVDNDGKNDLIVTPERGENRRVAWFYKNTGTNSIPDFNLQQRNFQVADMMDLGEGACPAFFDYNYDGLADMVVGDYGEYNSINGSYKTSLSLYRNTGTSSAASFTLVTHDYAGISSLLLDGPLCPTFGDLNSDGVEDMILGNGDGHLYYFTGSGNPVTFTLAASNFAGIDVGNASTPSLADLNNDSKYDLVVGEQNGFLSYFENFGTFTSPIFTPTATIDTLGGVNVRTPGFTDGYAVPFIYYESGHYNMWVSCAMGKVYKYENIDANLFGTFPKTDSLINGSQGERLTFNIAASGAYLDSDGMIDMAIGNYGGGIQFFTSINPTAVQQVSAPQPFVMYPNPASDAVTIAMKSPNNSLVTAEIYNNMGQLVQRRDFSTGKLVMEIDGWSPGIYLARITVDGYASTAKFLVAPAK
jgi:hypothetical protein